MRSLVVIALLLLAGMGRAFAHDLPVNQMVNAIARAEGRQADLIARVPMDLLRGVPFPIVDGHYDLANSAQAVELADLLLADAFTLAEDGRRVAPSHVEGRVVAASDRHFDSFEHAFDALAAPADIATPVAIDTGYLVVHFSYPIASARGRFEIQSQIALDAGVLAPLTLRFQRAGEPVRALIIPGGADPVDLDPAWWRAASGFVVLGVEHILSGTDHLLFLLCLVIPVLRLRDIVPVVTAFTVAHSVTLIASAMGVAPRGTWFPPLVEAAIAASIVYTALENLLRKRPNRRWLLSCAFGLVHGFGFSNALGDSLQFAGRHLVLSLLAFNVGIEAGQLGVLAVGLPVLVLLRRWLGTRRTVVLLSGFGAALGGFWLVERLQALRALDKACNPGCADNAFIGLLMALAVGLCLAGIPQVRGWFARAALSSRSLNENP